MVVCQGNPSFKFTTGQTRKEREKGKNGKTKRGSKQKKRRTPAFYWLASCNGIFEEGELGTGLFSWFL